MENLFVSTNAPDKYETVISTHPLSADNPVTVYVLVERFQLPVTDVLFAMLYVTEDDISLLPKKTVALVLHSGNEV